jgi:hypothetical protein
MAVAKGEKVASSLFSAIIKVNLTKPNERRRK